MIRCDKCGQEIIPEHNDIVVVVGIAEILNRGGRILDTDIFRGELSLFRLSKPARHFLPVLQEGERVCDGSPSRAQYIEGQARDTRGYPYIAEHEAIFRAAYAKAQEMYPE